MATIQAQRNCVEQWIQRDDLVQSLCSEDDANRQKEDKIESTCRC